MGKLTRVVISLEVHEQLFNLIEEKEWKSGSNNVETPVNFAEKQTLPIEEARNDQDN
jgi:hypothetical protein